MAEKGRDLNYWEILVAVLIGCFGAYVAWHGSHYSLGQVARMGPGFVPVSLGIILIVIAFALVFEVQKLARVPLDIPLRSILYVSAAVLTFAVVVPRFGLIPAIACLVVISGLAERPLRPKTMAISTVVLSIIGVVLFVRGLGIPLSPVRW